MAKQYTYRIEGLFPSQGLRGNYFRIELDLEFAKRARAMKLLRRQESLLETTARGFAKDLGFSRLAMRDVFMQFDGSLLTNINVPGNSCGLDIRDKDRYTLNSSEPSTDPILYLPHNVDYWSQAFCLIEIFAHWEEFIQAGIYIKEHKIRG